MADSDVYDGGHIWPYYGRFQDLAFRVYIDEVPWADLAITKTHNETDVGPGDPITYTIIVTNSGPVNVTGASVSDTFPSELTGATYTASQTGGASGFTANGSGDINDTAVIMPAGSQITYTVQATIVAAATGTLSNTATVSAPAGLIDPDNNNNTATDDIQFNADLAITKTHNETDVGPGDPITYTIVVTNSGPANVTGASVSDTFPSELTGATYTASQTGGASGFTAIGSGDINDTVNMPAGSQITYTVQATIVAAATGTLSNTATVSAAGLIDPDNANNTATDDTQLNLNFIPIPIPTINAWGIVSLVVLFAAVAIRTMRRRNRSAQ